MNMAGHEAVRENHKPFDGAVYPNLPQRIFDDLGAFEGPETANRAKRQVDNGADPDRRIFESVVVVTSDERTRPPPVSA